ncbi:MAG TPA: hypothetical protein VG944_22125 [Fimbriimonas sp.]|nr:hypothetical protein [Fimbriimonas sp.]
MSLDTAGGVAERREPGARVKTKLQKSAKKEPFESLTSVILKDFDVEKPEVPLTRFASSPASLAADRGEALAVLEDY